MCFRYTVIEFVYLFVKIRISSVYLFLVDRPPPLLEEAIAGILSTIEIVEKDNAIAAAAKKNTILYGYIKL
jgi:hypothetical protein